MELGGKGKVTKDQDHKNERIGSILLLRRRDATTRDKTLG